MASPRRSPKALLDEENDLEFQFFLAQKLSMTVAELRDRMTHAEYVGWSRYFAVKAQREELERLKAGL